MAVLPATMSLTARLRLKEILPDIPEFKGCYVDRTENSAFPGTRSEVRVRLTDLSLTQIEKILVRERLAIGFGFLDEWFHDNFWEQVPPDCVGGFLHEDGHLSFPTGVSSWHIIPLDEPLYCSGRPDVECRPFSAPASRILVWRWHPHHQQQTAQGTRTDRRHR